MIKLDFQSILKDSGPAEGNVGDGVTNAAISPPFAPVRGGDRVENPVHGVKNRSAPNTSNNAAASEQQKEIAAVASVSDSVTNRVAGTRRSMIDAAMRNPKIVEVVRNRDGCDVKVHYAKIRDLPAAALAAFKAVDKDTSGCISLGE